MSDAPRTVVFQSFRTHDVPAWLAACLASVRAWADSAGHDYVFYDDEFFGFAPDWYREKCAGQVLPITDLARLVAARRLLDAGYARAVWVDADMFVFAPDAFRLPELATGYAFCREWWFAEHPTEERYALTPKVNNSVSVFDAGNPFLDFYIQSITNLVAVRPEVGRLAVGTDFLTHLSMVVPMAVMNVVGVLSPPLLLDCASPDPAKLRAYRERVGVPLVAANLCSSLRHSEHRGRILTDDVFERAMEVAPGLLGA